MCLRAASKINHPAGKHTYLTEKKKEEGQKPSMCDPCTKYLQCVMLLPLHPEFSNLVTVFTPRHPISRASCFSPCYFRITPLKQPLSKHPAHSSHPSLFLPANLLSNSAPSFKSHQEAVTARNRFNQQEMVFTQNWMRSSADRQILFTIIQNFCTDKAAKEDVTKISMCNFDNPLMPSLLVGGLRDHRVWICPQPALLQQPREVLVASKGCFWEVRSPLWNKTAYFSPRRNYQKCPKGKRTNTSHWNIFYSSSKVLQWYFKWGEK